MNILALPDIKQALTHIDLLPVIEAGFEAYSAGQSVVPPVGELLLDKGDVHIKYGYLKGDDYYVIKIASGFYENTKIGLPSSNGLMLLFRQQTGEIVSILLDEGHLTDTRTAVAGAIVAKYLAPRKVETIGIVGTGIQAHLQLRHLKNVTDCRQVLAWGRGQPQLKRFREEIAREDFEIATTLEAAEILQSCRLVVTTTPATEPLLHARDLRAGTHITAVGSDTPQKQELDTAILRQADLVVADSIAQCVERGEIAKALKSGDLAKAELVELGEVIAGKVPGRTGDEQITVADLTGVAVQDIQIAKAVFASS